MTRDGLNKKVTWEQDLKEMKEQASQISGGRRFKEEGEAHGKTLRQECAPPHHRRRQPAWLEQSKCRDSGQRQGQGGKGTGRVGPLRSQV